MSTPTHHTHIIIIISAFQRFRHLGSFTYVLSLISLYFLLISFILQALYVVFIQPRSHLSTRPPRTPSSSFIFDFFLANSEKEIFTISIIRDDPCYLTPQYRPSSVAQHDISDLM